MVLLTEAKDRAHREQTNYRLKERKEYMLNLREYTTSYTQDRVTKEAVKKAIRELAEANNLIYPESSYLEIYTYEHKLPYPTIPD